MGAGLDIQATVHVLQPASFQALMLTIKIQTLGVRSQQQRLAIIPVQLTCNLQEVRPLCKEQPLPPSPCQAMLQHLNPVNLQLVFWLTKLTAPSWLRVRMHPCQRLWYQSCSSIFVL